MLLDSSWDPGDNNDLDWKKFNKVGACGLAFFPDLDLKNGAAANNVVPFKEKTEDKAEGCVFVSWKRTTNNRRWKGIMRIEWLIKKGNEGLLGYAAYKNSKDGGYIDMFLVAHSLKNEDSKWIVKNTKEYSKDSSAYNFSKDSGWGYWGFNLEDHNGCKWNNNSLPECNFSYKDSTKTNSSTKLYQWREGGNGDKQKFSDWSRNFHIWWNYLLGSGFKINNVRDLLGIWTEIN